MAKNFSKYACDGGIREVTDPLRDDAREAIIAALENDTAEDDESPVIAFLIKVEKLAGFKVSDDHDAAIHALARTLAADLVRQVQFDDDDYRAGLREVGDALDYFVDDAVEKATECYSEDAYERGYSDGFDSGHREAEEEAETAAEEAADKRDTHAARCPTCGSIELRRDHANPHVAVCAFCATEWRMIHAETPMAVFGMNGAPVSFLTPEAAPADRAQYAARCGLESAPLTVGEER